MILKKLALFGEGHAASALSNLAVRVGGAVIAFANQIILARMLGVSDTGTYFFCLSLVMAACQFGVFGLDNTMIRFVSYEWEKAKHSLVAGISLQGVSLSILTGFLISIVTFMLAPMLAEMLSDGGNFLGVMRVMVFSIVPYGAIIVLAGIFKAIKEPTQAALVESILIPLILLILLLSFAALNRDFSPVIAAYFYVFSSFVILAYAIVIGSRKIGRQTPREFIKPQKLVRTAWPLMLVSVMGFLTSYFSSLCLGILDTPHSVGLFSVALRTASLLGFILIAFNSIAAPRFAIFYKNNDVASIQKFAIRSSTIMCCVALPGIILMLVAPDLILWVFGPEFYQAGLPLRILAIGQLFSLMCGSAGVILMMTGNERVLREILQVTSIVCIAMNWALISWFGMIGAALATCGCIVLLSVLTAYSVYRKLGIVVIPGGNYLQNVLRNR